ncbi:MAG: class I SAM-dependent methyltransferase [Anaerolineae bacterium]
MSIGHWDAESVPETDLQTRLARVLPWLGGVNSIVEVGSGRGQTLRRLAGSADLLLGIDLAPELLHQSATAHGEVEHVQADAQRLPLADDTFDTAIAQEVLEHVADWSQVLEELFRVARRRVVITVPYQEWLKGLHCPQCGTWARLYDHRHRFSPETFSLWRHRGRVTIQTIAPPQGLRDYGRKGLRWLARKSEQGETAMVRCPECGALFPPELRWKRAIDRLWRIISKKPEWLLVVWELEVR